MPPAGPAASSAVSAVTKGGSGWTGSDRNDASAVPGEHCEGWRG